jgi:hypothetical protein
MPMGRSGSYLGSVSPDRKAAFGVCDDPREFPFETGHLQLLVSRLLLDGKSPGKGYGKNAEDLSIAKTAFTPVTQDQITLLRKIMI